MKINSAVMKGGAGTLVREGGSVRIGRYGASPHAPGKKKPPGGGCEGALGGARRLEPVQVLGG